MAHLEKFYVDVVTDDGSGCIGYTGRIRALGMERTLAATLRWKADRLAPIEQRRTVRGTLPAVSDAEIDWQCPALGIDGQWERRSPEQPAALAWLDGAGTFEWKTLATSAPVTLRLHGEKIGGWGYAEKLSLNFSPRRLPIDVMRWGRFVSPTQSVVWLEWTSVKTRRWLWHNGHEVADTVLDVAGAGWPGHRLNFGAGRPLRSGPLSDTVLARWPQVRRWLPQWLQAFDETKWCAAGALTGPDGIRHEGWVIHERVRFR